MKNEEKHGTLNAQGKIILCLVIVMLAGIIPVLAEVQSLGNFKINECVKLKQTCSNCTYNNITSVQIDGTSTQLLNQVVMTKSGTEYNYTFCSTSQIGTYIVNGKGDVDGVLTVWAYDFNVTPSGFADTLGFYFLIIGISAVIIIGGFLIKDAYITIFGTFGLYFVGTYVLINGINGIKDMATTWAIGLVLLGVAGYISIKSAMETMGE